MLEEGLAEGPRPDGFTEQFGFRVRQECYYEPVSHDYKISPDTFTGMSGGAIWGGLRDEVGLIGIVTHQSDQRHYPREFWGAGIKKALELIESSEQCVDSESQTGPGRQL